jgi:MFS family permease
MLGMVATVLCYTGVLLATDVNWLIVLQLLGGFATGIRMSMGYVYMMEFLP